MFLKTLVSADYIKYSIIMSSQIFISMIYITHLKSFNLRLTLAVCNTCYCLTSIIYLGFNFWHCMIIEPKTWGIK